MQNVTGKLGMIGMRIIIAWAGGMLLMVATAQGQITWYVDDDASPGGSGTQEAPFDSIHQAIDAGTNGDEVLVLDGTYGGELDFDGKLLTLRSAAGPDNCIINGGGFVFRNSETPEASVEGFTIRGGQTTALDGEPWGGAILIHAASPTVADMVFEGNSATWDGGAIAIFRGSPTIINCTFIGNTAGHDGGGICNRDGSPTITNCVFVGNFADNNGGGVYTDSYFEPANVVLTDCMFLGNTANGVHGYGGGLWSGGNTTLVNCAFSGNSAFSSGAISSFWDSMTLANCTISRNTATDFGGGLFADGFTSHATAMNSIFWGNSDLGGTDELGQIYVAGGTLVVDSSCVQGWTGELEGTGNIDADPRFVDADGPDDILGTADDDLHLSAESPCINAGDNNAPMVPELDFEGDARIQQCRIDMGADETGLFRDCNSNEVPDACDIAAGTSPDCDGNGVPDECDADCNSNGFPDECDLFAGTSADCNANGVPDECDINSGTSLDDNTNNIPDECEAEILYVQKDAVGGNNGTSWTDAYNDLLAALAIASAPGNAVTEIWVAGGTYHPSADGDRTAAFALLNGIAIYGGFAGSETSLDERNPLSHATILSGDLEENDSGTEGLDDNSYRVVTAEGVDATAVLDGFVLTAGNAEVERCTTGGGMFVHDADPIIANCTFHANQADCGGGLYVEDGSPTVINCTFYGNRADVNGGAVYNESGSPVVVNTLFTGNLAEVKGGAVCNSGLSLPTFTNCTIVGNVSQQSGGIYSMHGNNATLANCILWGNRDLDGCDESAQLGGAASEVNYSCVQGLTTGRRGLAGIGNIAEDPRFIDADGADNIPGTADDDVRLGAGSPCIDAADNEADIDANTSGVQSLPETDLAGNGRFFDDPAAEDTGNPPLAEAIVDMGVYEYQEDCNGNMQIDSVDLATGISSDCDSNGVPDECDPDCNSNGIPDPCDITAGTSADCNNNDFPDECDLAGGTSVDLDSNGIPDDCEPDCNGNGMPDPYDIATGTSADCNNNGVPDECDIAGGTSVDLDSNGVPDECDPPVVRYVDGGAPPGGDGLSWATAYDDLQDALEEAAGSGGLVNNIWVAAATYTPDRSTGDPYSTFQLLNGIGLFGGFSGIETSLDQRNPAIYLTILSGEFGDGENSYHVVTGSGTNATAVIDGFTITDGNADGPSGQEVEPSYSAGGGMYNWEGSPTVTNCTFSGNSANDDGGGMYNYRSSSTVINCILWGNVPDEIYERSSSGATVTYSDVQGGWPGEGNISVDPLFVDADGPDGIAGTMDDDLRLLPESPCIDAGNNYAVPADSADLEGDGNTP